MLKFYSAEGLYTILPCGTDLDYVCEIVESFKAQPDVEALFTYTHGCIAIRIFDGGVYCFVSPIPVSDSYSLKDALTAVRDYAVREMLSPVFTDVLRDELAVYSEVFKMPRATAYRDDEDLFELRAESELDLLTEVPLLTYGRVTLSKIRELDKERYATLCLDGEVNRFWGYDVREDNPNADADYLMDVVRRERELGIALSLGVFYGGELIGEAVLYSFDFAGGASFAVRLLSEYHGMGLGGESFLALTELARKIGLDRIRTEVMNENVASVAACKKYFDIGQVFDEKTEFKKKL